MNIGRWLIRYAEKAMMVCPSLTRTQAIELAISGLSSLVNEEVRTEYPPEYYADVDISSLISKQMVKQ